MLKQRNIIDTGFEGLCTGLEMIEAVFDEYERCHPRSEPRLKTDDPGTFEQSLCEDQNNTNLTSRRK
jgi:hypothetical protein